MTAPLIAVWSPKGGVGKSLIAAGLAATLVRRMDGPVLLADLDGKKADLAPLLQTGRHPSLLDFDGERVATLALPGGLHLLPGPVRLTEEPLVTGHLVERMLTVARAQFAAVVADLGADLRESTLTTLGRATVTLLVVTPDLLAIYAGRRFVAEAKEDCASLAAFRLLINRTTPRQEITEREICELIELPLAGQVPSLPGLAAAVNRGMLSSTLRSQTDFAQALEAVADNLHDRGIPSRRAPAAGPATAPKPGLIPALKRWWQGR